MIEGYSTVKSIAEKWRLTERTVQIMCAEGKIKGATKFGGVWAIPSDAKKPTDNRVISGEYKNWMFFAEVKCRLLQNAMYVGCCKIDLGGYTPKPL